MSSTDGTKFCNKFSLAESSEASPSLCFANGKLYLLWCGTDAKRSLNVIEWNEKTGFVNKITLPGSSRFAPALAFHDGRFYLAWTGQDSYLYTMVGFDLNKMYYKRSCSYTSIAAPSLLAFKGQLYLSWSSSDGLCSVNIAALLQPAPTTSNATVPGGMPGAMLSLSANGSKAGTAIVWASHPYDRDANQQVVEGILRAFDATDVRRELWNSKQNPNRDDNVGLFAKFCPPTVVNGKVYMATFSGYIAVYSLSASD